MKKAQRKFFNFFVSKLHKYLRFHELLALDIHSMRIGLVSFRLAPKILDKSRTFYTN